MKYLGAAFLADHKLPGLVEHLVIDGDLAAYPGLIAKTGPPTKRGSRFSERTVFLEAQDGKKLISGVLTFAESPRAAQSSIVGPLCLSSMAKEEMAKQYFVLKDGPGEFCLASLAPGDWEGKPKADLSRLHFVRGNVAVRLFAADKTTSVFPLAREMDGMIVAAMAKAEAAEQAAKTQAGAEPARADDGAVKKPEAGASKAGEASQTPATEPGKP